MEPVTNRLKVCSFNIRTECDKTPNSFPERAPYILETIRKENPDIIGFQEVSVGIRTFLRENLTDVYALEGCGRSTALADESMLIAYRKDTFEPLETRNFWLSDTPAVPGSTYGLDQSHCPRMVTALRLYHHNGGEPFWFYNTHLDHVGKMARLCGAMQVLQDVSLHTGKFILTGDFNATPDAPEIALIRNFKNAGRSTVVDASERLSDTFHGYEKPGANCKIDYIFTDAACDSGESYMLPGKPVNENGTYVSDHCPIFAFITI